MLHRERLYWGTNMELYSLSKGISCCYHGKKYCPFPPPNAYSSFWVNIEKLNPMCGKLLCRCAFLDCLYLYLSAVWCSCTGCTEIVCIAQKCRQFHEIWNCILQKLSIFFPKCPTVALWLGKLLPHLGIVLVNSLNVPYTLVLVQVMLFLLWMHRIGISEAQLQGYPWDWEEGGGWDHVIRCNWTRALSG